MDFQNFQNPCLTKNACFGCDILVQQNQFFLQFIVLVAAIIFLGGAYILVLEIFMMDTVELGEVDVASDACTDIDTSSTQEDVDQISDQASTADQDDEDHDVTGDQSSDGWSVSSSVCSNE